VITDPLTTGLNGWNLSSTTASQGGGWGFFSAPGNNKYIATPNSGWSTRLYNAGTDDRAYKIFNLASMSSANNIILSMDTAINIANFDYFKSNFNSNGGDPFQGGTPIFSITNTKTNTTSFRADFDITKCASATCAIGIQLLSTLTSSRDIGVAIPYLSIQSLTLNSNSYNTLSGTSMATPEVTGVAALIWAHNPQFTNTDVINALEQSGRTVPALNGLTVTGKAVDALKALTYIQPPKGISAQVK
jgi:subtilisin family serine protease